MVSAKVPAAASSTSQNAMRRAWGPSLMQLSFRDVRQQLLALVQQRVQRYHPLQAQSIVQCLLRHAPAPLRFLSLLAPGRRHLDQPAARVGTGVQREPAGGDHFNPLGTVVKSIGPRVQRVRAEGKVLHCGRQLATAEARLFGPDGTLYAHATTTCLVFELRAAGSA
jgi:hypothetical protein